MCHGISVCMIPSSGVHWPHRRLHCYRVVENTLQTEACCSCATKNCTKVSTRLGPTLREVLPCECLCPGPTRSQKHGPSGGEGDRGRHSPSRTGYMGRGPRRGKNGDGSSRGLGSSLAPKRVPISAPPALFPRPGLGFRLWFLRLSPHRFIQLPIRAALVPVDKHDIVVVRK